ncbi:MAG: hypothetical protein AAGM16_12880 [Pseudomonadota bacterium]
MTDPRQRLLERIGNINDFSLPRPLVTLEEFFEGNDDYGSIGYNFYPDQPAPSEFWQYFAKIRDRDDVATVLIQVSDQEDPDGWPSTDTVWIVTSGSADDVKAWLGDRFQADELLIGTPDHVEQVEIPSGYEAIGVWYD